MIGSDDGDRCRFAKETESLPIGVRGKVEGYHADSLWQPENLPNIKVCPSSGPGPQSAALVKNARCFAEIFFSSFSRTSSMSSHTLRFSVMV